MASVTLLLVQQSYTSTPVFGLNILKPLKKNIMFTGGNKEMRIKFDILQMFLQSRTIYYSWWTGVQETVDILVCIRYLPGILNLCYASN